MLIATGRTRESDSQELQGVIICYCYDYCWFFSLLWLNVHGYPVKKVELIKLMEAWVNDKIGAKSTKTVFILLSRRIKLSSKLHVQLLRACRLQTWRLARAKKADSRACIYRSLFLIARSLVKCRAVSHGSKVSFIDLDVWDKPASQFAILARFDNRRVFELFEGMSNCWLTVVLWRHKR